MRGIRGLALGAVVCAIVAPAGRPAWGMSSLSPAEMTQVNGGMKPKQDCVLVYCGTGQECAPAGFVEKYKQWKKINCVIPSTRQKFCNFKEPYVHCTEVWTFTEINCNSSWTVSYEDPFLYCEESDTPEGP